MDELQKLVDELKKRIEELESQNKVLVDTQQAALKAAYESSFEAVSNAVDKADLLEADFSHIWDKIKRDELYQTLLEVNNPASDKLGFSFVDIVVDIAVEKIGKQLPDFTNPQDNRKRWTNVVGKLVKNDFVSALLRSNPITGVVSSVIGAAANFIGTKINVVKNKAGKVVSDVTGTTETMVTEQMINAFVAELKDYIQFYDNLLQASNRFEEGLATLKNRNRHLTRSAKNVNKNLLNILGISGGAGKITKLLALYDKTNPNVDMRAILEKKEVKDATKYVRQFEVLQAEVALFKRDYNMLFATFLEDYRDNLSSSKSSSMKVDNGKVDGIIRQIDEMLDGIEKGSGKAKDISFSDLSEN